jgi:hypothetical protein
VYIRGVATALTTVLSFPANVFDVRGATNLTCLVGTSSEAKQQRSEVKCNAEVRNKWNHTSVTSTGLYTEISLHMLLLLN